MKVTFELDTNEDQFKYELMLYASEMFRAFMDLDSYARDLRKEYAPFEYDTVLDKLGEILGDSRISDIT